MKPFLGVRVTGTTVRGQKRTNDFRYAIGYTYIGTDRYGFTGSTNKLLVTTYN